MFSHITNFVFFLACIQVSVQGIYLASYENDFYVCRVQNILEGGKEVEVEWRDFDDSAIIPVTDLLISNVTIFISKKKIVFASFIISVHKGSLANFPSSLKVKITIIF